MTTDTQLTPPADTIAARADAIREDFAFLDDWESRFAYVIDAGRALPPLAADEMTEANRVRGCASQVWLVAEPSSRLPGALSLRGGSDALIVSGLVGLVLRLLSDQPPRDILAFDAEAFFAGIGLSAALTPQRSNGLRSMLARIREHAAALPG